MVLLLVGVVEFFISPKVTLSDKLVAKDRGETPPSRFGLGETDLTLNEGLVSLDLSDDVVNPAVEPPTPNLLGLGETDLALTGTGEEALRVDCLE